METFLPFLMIFSLGDTLQPPYPCFESEIYCLNVIWAQKERALNFQRSFVAPPEGTGAVLLQGKPLVSFQLEEFFSFSNKSAYLAMFAFLNSSTIAT